MKNKITNIIFAFLTAFAFFINSEEFLKIKSDINPFKVGVLSIAIIVIMIIVFYSKIKNKKIHFTKEILCILFSLFIIFGNSYALTNSWKLVFGNNIILLVAMLSFLGYYIFFKKGFILLDNFLDKYKDKNFKISKNKTLNKILKFIDEKPFISSIIIMLVFWLIYIISFYPLILSPDPSYQIEQFFNVHTKYSDWVIQLDESVNITNHHPVIHTLLLGGCIKLGRLISNDNFGLFIYSIIQISILVTTLAYTIKYAKKENVSNKYRIIMLLIYSIVPIFPLYAMSGVKDTIYSSFIILYVIFLHSFIKHYKNKKLEIKKIIIVILLLLLIGMFRNNGLYVVVLSFPFIIFYSKKNMIKTTIIFISFLTLFMTYTKVILPYFKITDGSIREVLSIPFQQTARYAKYNSNDLSNEDKKIIDKVLGYNDIAKRYNPKKSDPVKNNYNKNTTKEELNDYFHVWFKGLLKHPETYVEATLNNTYGYFYPADHNWYVYYKFDNRITDNNLVDYHYNDLKKSRNILSEYSEAFPNIPLVGLIVSIGFNTWILLIMSAYLISKNKIKYLIVLAPLLVSVLVCIASPVNTYFRYAMPYIFVMPLMLGLFLKIIERRDKNETKNCGINTLL